jgi:hypothetical protein
VSEPTSNDSFVSEFRGVQAEAHHVNLLNGWWGEREAIIDLCADKGIDFRPHLAIQLLGLTNTENSEAIEAARKQDPETWKDYTKPDTMVREMAGAIVRLMDMAQYFELPLGKAILAEIEANRQRGFRHGGKAA